jgi:hypothetical protein
VVISLDTYREPTRRGSTKAQTVHTIVIVQKHFSGKRLTLKIRSTPGCLGERAASHTSIRAGTSTLSSSHAVTFGDISSKAMSSEEVENMKRKESE